MNAFDNVIWGWYIFALTVGVAAFLGYFVVVRFFPDKREFYWDVVGWKLVALCAVTLVVAIVVASIVQPTFTPDNEQQFFPIVD